MNSPQQVTSRYVRNLLVKGENNDFRIESLIREYTMIDQLNVGFYFTAMIHQKTIGAKSAAGVTPEQAVHRCLEKHAVTFR